MNGREVPQDPKLLEFPGVMFDIANLDGTGGIEKVLAGEIRGSYRGRMPTDRLVFGSHAPFFPLENALFKFVESELNPADLAAVLQGNADRLLSRG